MHKRKGFIFLFVLNVAKKFLIYGIQRDENGRGRRRLAPVWGVMIPVLGAVALIWGASAPVLGTIAPIWGGSARVWGAVARIWAFLPRFGEPQTCFGSDRPGFGRFQVGFGDHCPGLDALARLRTRLLPEWIKCSPRGSANSYTAPGDPGLRPRPPPAF